MGEREILSAADPSVAEAADLSVSTDELVVRRVYERCSARMAQAVEGSSVRVDFLGALVANESGGQPDAAHFEEWVYRCLCEVALGQEPAFGSIGRAQLSAFLRANAAAQTADEQAVPAVPGGSQMEQAIRQLSTSWGYTQIMGYQVIGRGERTAALLDPAFHFHLAVELLTSFARRYRLKPATDFEALFRCWNTGRPEGETFNPGYVTLGLRRMALYRELMERGATPAGGTEGLK